MDGKKVLFVYCLLFTTVFYTVAYRKISSVAVVSSIGPSLSLKVICIILYTLEILQTVPQTNPEPFRTL